MRFNQREVRVMLINHLHTLIFLIAKSFNTTNWFFVWLNSITTRSILLGMPCLRICLDVEKRHSNVITQL